MCARHVGLQGCLRNIHSTAPARLSQPQLVLLQGETELPSFNPRNAWATDLLHAPPVWLLTWGRRHADWLPLATLWRPTVLRKVCTLGGSAWAAASRRRSSSLQTEHDHANYLTDE